MANRLNPWLEWLVSDVGITAVVVVFLLVLILIFSGCAPLKTIREFVTPCNQYHIVKYNGCSDSAFSSNPCNRVSLQPCQLCLDTSACIHLYSGMGQ